MMPTLSRKQPNAAMAQRGMRSAAELAADKPCGTRLRYYAGCRCGPCRAANSEYENARRIARKAGDHRGLVSTERARQHMLALRASGVGWKTVADAAKIGNSTAGKVLYKPAAKIRAHTERAILAVTTACAADRTYIDARPSWELLDDLLAVGWSKRRLGSEIIGHPVTGLQLVRGRITVRNAARVRAVWQRLRYASPADTRHAIRQIAELREEGYRADWLQRELLRLGVASGQPVPEPCDRQRHIGPHILGRLPQRTVELTALLHSRLTGAHLLADEPATA
jgi:hypothetical protein